MSLLSGCKNTQEMVPTLKEVSISWESPSMACMECSGGVCRAQGKAFCTGHGVRPRAEQLLGIRLGA